MVTDYSNYKLGEVLYLGEGGLGEGHASKSLSADIDFAAEKPKGTW